MLAPLTVRVEEAPEHNVALLPVTLGAAFTITEMVLVAVQPFVEVPMMVYVSVPVGEAVTEDPVVVFNPVAGLQV